MASETGAHELPRAQTEREAALKQNARFGMLALAARSALQNLVTLGANVFLVRLLGPGDYGVFGILHFAMSFFRLLSDTGLGAALVRKAEPPDEAELSTLFWFQLGFGALLVALSFAALPLVRRIWPSLPPGSEWLLPGLTLSLAFSLLMSVPFLILERDVRFGWVGTLELLGTLTFYTLALLFAARGAGAAALVWAEVAQAALLCGGALLVQPWRPKLTFRWKRIQALLKFGSALQGTQIVGYANGAVTPLLVGAGLGKDAVGLLQFAESTAWFPTQVVGLVRRVHFPLFCRLQANPQAFRREFERAILLSALPTFFCFGLFLGTAPGIVGIVYGAKWLPSVPALYVYSFGFCFVFFSWIGDAALAAVNGVRSLLKISILVCVVNWSATLAATALSRTPLAFACGFLLHVVLSPTLMYLALRARVPGLTVFRRLWPLVISAGVLATLGRLVLPYLDGWSGLLLWLAAAVLLFTALTLALHRELRRIALPFAAKYLGRRRAYSDA